MIVRYEEMLRIEDTIEQKYRRLKFLVETTTKLYGEFWGILATNLTNNLNLNKLFLIGNKLNKFLNEINTLWENDLKNKKIDSVYKWFKKSLKGDKKYKDFYIFKEGKNNGHNKADKQERTQQETHKNKKGYIQSGCILFCFYDVFYFIN